MKKLLSIVLLLVITCASVCYAFASGETLISVEDFALNFSFYDSFLGLDHKLADEPDELSRLTDSILMKYVFNNCEILSLIITPDAKQVQSIRCTLDTNAPGASSYAEDFTYMFMVVLCTCGMSTDSVQEVITEIGDNSTFAVGTSVETVVDGIRVGLDVTSYAGVTFSIDKA